MQEVVLVSKPPKFADGAVVPTSGPPTDEGPPSEVAGNKVLPPPLPFTFLSTFTFAPTFPSGCGKLGAIGPITISM